MTLRILITGSRDYTDRMTFTRTVDRWINEHCPMMYRDHIPIERDTSDVVIVHGGARGADSLAEDYGQHYGVKTEVHALTKQDWERSPRMAGYERNIKMVSLGADVCIAFINLCKKNNCNRIKAHGSHGACHCSDLAEHSGIDTIRIGP